MSLVSRRARRSGRMYANDLSFLNPALLSREAVLRLPSRMVLARLVARNFSPQPAMFGDVVSFPRPGVFKMTRKDSICDTVQFQDITGDRIQARLDQWPQVSFKICDGETRDVATLIQDELNPAIDALANGIDAIVAGQVMRLMKANKLAGHLNNVTPTNIYSYILEARQMLNDLNVPEEDRILSLTSTTETQGLQSDLFARVDASGSNDALRRASLGQLVNFDLVQPSRQPSITNTQPKTTALVNVAGGLNVGSTLITYDGQANGTFVVGQWVVVSGDDTPLQITAAPAPTGGAGTITVAAPGLRRAVADNAAIAAIIPGAVNNALGYRGRDSNTGKPGWAKEIVVDGFTAAPQLGQGVTFGGQTEIYSVIGVNGLVGITLDRPLELALTDNMTVNLLPSGQYNMAFRPNAFALVMRPIAAPMQGAGAIGRTQNFNNVTVRVTIWYDGSEQSHKITLDLFAGINVMDADQALPMLG